MLAGRFCVYKEKLIYKENFICKGKSGVVTKIKLRTKIKKHNQLYRSSHQRCSLRKGVLRNFAKFTGKHLCQSLFFNKVAGAACNFIKKETLTQVFSCEFCEISKNTCFTEHLRTTASSFIS